MITTQYHMRIDFEPKYVSGLSDREQSEVAEQKMFDIANKFGVHDFEQFLGCPACGPYITAWSWDVDTVRDLYSELYQYLVYELGWKVTS